MLKGMRRSAKHILWPLTIAMVIAMGGFGVWNLVGPETSRTKIGAIWGEPVQLEEFIQTARTARALAALAGQEPDRRELYLTAWRRILLHREAERLGIAATRRDLARFLARWPAFQVDGRFNADRYSRVLGGLGLETSVFETEAEKLLGVELMNMLIRNQALATPAEARRIYGRMNEEVRVEYARVGSEGISPLREIPEEDISGYFRENRGEFQVQTEIAISYVLLEFDDFADPDRETAEPETLAAGEEESGADQTGTTAGEAAAAAQADAIIQKLVYVDSLAGPAQEYGLEIRESGYFPSAGEIPGVGAAPEIGRMVGWMEMSEIASYPIRTDKGFLIFQLTGIQEARQQEMEEVRGEIREILLGRARREEALKIAREKLDQVRSLIETKEMDFAAAAGEAGLKTETTTFFTRRGGDGLPPAPQFVNASFLISPGEVSNLVEGEDGFFFLTVLERKAAPPMPEEAEAEWMEIALRSGAGMLYDSWFNNLIRRSGFSILQEEFAP